MFESHVQAEMEELRRQNSELRDLIDEYGSKTTEKGKETLQLPNGNISEETSSEGKLLIFVFIFLSWPHKQMKACVYHFLFCYKEILIEN